MGNGDGTFLPPASYGPNGFNLTGAGDVNGDGRIDFLDGSAVELQIVQPVAALSASDLNFGAVLFGKASTPQAVTLQNTGNAAMSISSIVFAGANASEFSQTNNCGSSLAAGAKCGINLTFTPSSGGSASASLAITDNAPGNPHKVALQGIGEDFSVAASPGATTVTPGQAANYTLTVAPLSGFNQTVALSCSGAPEQSKCSVSPSSVTLDGTHSATSNVAVVTTAASMGMTQPIGQPPNGNIFAIWITLVGVLGLAGTLSLRNKRELRPGLLGTLAFLCLLSAGATMLACGGGNGGGGNGGTPAGSYTLTVTGTYTAGSAQLAHGVKITLTVE